MNVRSVICGWLCGGFLLAGSSDAATVAEVQAEIGALRRKVQALETHRDSLAKTMPAATSGWTDGCLVLELAGAVHGHDARLELVRRGGTWTDGRATARKWNLDIFPVDARQLQVAGQRVTGPVTAQLAAWSDQRRDQPDRGVPFPVVWKLDLTATGNQVTGKATLANVGDAPLATGPWEVRGEWILFGGAPKFPAPPPAAELDAGLSGEAGWLGARAVQLYEDIRALESSRATGLPFALARANGPNWRVEYANPEMAAAPPEPPKSKKPKGSAVPSLDDIGLDEKPSPGSRKVNVDYAKVAALVRLVRTHVAVVTAAATNNVTGTVTVGDVDAGDPEFWPADAISFLPVGKDGESVLPAWQAAAFPRWPAVAAWRALGPFPLQVWQPTTSYGADVVPIKGALSRIDPKLFPGLHGMGAYQGPEVHGWEPVRSDPRTGLARPPDWMKNHANNYTVPGMDWGAAYAAADVIAPAAGEWWVAFRGDDEARLWVDDRLVWVSGPVDNLDGVRARRFRVTLRSGVNRLLLRVENKRTPHCFALHFCTEGGPRAADVARAEIARREALYAKLTPPQTGLTGFRHDQSGVYPGPAPVAAWDLERGINVLWRTELGSNFGSVSVAEGRAYTWEDPFTLVCLDATTGRVLWRRDVDTLEFDAASFAKAQELRKELATAAGEKAEELRNQLNRLYQAKAGHVAFSKDGLQGPSMSTPITDGKRVWARAHVNVVACFDRDGNRLWAAPLRPVGYPMGAKVSSPVLVAGKLISQVSRYVKGGSAPASAPTETTEDDEAEDSFQDRRSGRRFVLMAWDAATGKELWTSRDYVLPHFGNRYDADGIASPHPLRLTDGTQTLDVILTNGGQVFRVEDGALMAENLPYVVNPAPTPISDGRDTIYVSREDYGGHSGRFGKAYAYRLLLRGPDRVDCLPLWSRCYKETSYAGFVRCGDVLHEWDRVLSVVRADTGQHLGVARHLTRHQGGEAYPPATVAGGLVIVGDNGRSDYNKHQSWRNASLPAEERKPLLPANMTVLRGGATPVVLARNAMEPLTMGPAVADGRLYVRTQHALICLARTGAAGERYEAEQVAATVLATLPTTQPDESPVIETKPLTALPREYQPEPLVIGDFVGGWNCLAPVPAGEREATRKAWEFPGGTKLAASKEPRRFETRKQTAYPSEFVTEHMAFGFFYDLARVHQRQPGTVCLWSMIARNDRERVVRLDLGDVAARFWFNGVPVAHNQRVRLRYGDHLLAMETTLAEPVPSEYRFRVRFWDSRGWAEEQRARANMINRVRHDLENVARLAPDSQPGRQAAAVLNVTP